MMIRQSVFLLMLSIFWVACADYNSSTLDDLEYVEVTANETDLNFARAFEIIKNRCANCHEPNHPHQEWKSYNSNARWINESGVIVKNDAANSPLIKRTMRNGPSGNMPRDNSLTEQEYEDLKTWINNM
jgi:hypothetical protein